MFIKLLNMTRVTLTRVGMQRGVCEMSENFTSPCLKNGHRDEPNKTAH